MRGLRLILVLLVAAACGGYEQDRPLAAFGAYDRYAGGATYPVSEQFGPQEAERLHEILNSAAFRTELAQFNCGDPIRRYQFAVALFDAAAYRDRLVAYGSRPDMGTSGRERCLHAGMSYLWDRTVRSLDRGVIRNPGYRHPDGRIITDEEYRIRPMRRPVCDCSQRDAPGEWVTYPPEE